jgi:hypothetical protein
MLPGQPGGGHLIVTSEAQRRPAYFEMFADLSDVVLEEARGGPPNVTRRDRLTGLVSAVTACRQPG